MAYYTGSATDANDMLAQLANSLDQEGWTIHTNESLTGGRWICVQPPDLDEYTESPTIYSFRYDNGDGEPSLVTTIPDHLFLVGATGPFDSNESWNSQPGTQPQTNNARSNDWSSPINEYHFFIGDRYCHLVARDGSGYWHHASINIFSDTKSAHSQDTNNYDTGSNRHPGESQTNRHSRLYFSNTSTFNSSYVTRAYIDGDWKVSSNNTIGSLSFAAGHYHWTTQHSNVAGLVNGLWRAAENASTVTTPLIPAFCSYRRADSNWVTIGEVENFRYTNIRYLEAGDTFTFGTDEWLVFPCVRKTNNATDGSASQNQIDLVPNTYWMGYAYKK